MWLTHGDPIASRAFKVRIIWDKHRTGRHLNFGQEDDADIQVCPLCVGGPEDQAHILIRCEHPEMIAARSAAMNKVGGALRREVLRDPVIARFYERIHDIVTTHEEGYTLLLGMVSNEVLTALDDLPLPQLDTSRLYRRLVKFLSCYRDLCEGMYSTRARLMQERRIPSIPTAKRKGPPPP